MTVFDGTLFHGVFNTCDILQLFTIGEANIFYWSAQQIQPSTVDLSICKNLHEALGVLAQCMHDQGSGAAHARSRFHRDRGRGRDLRR